MRARGSYQSGVARRSDIQYVYPVPRAPTTDAHPARPSPVGQLCELLVEWGCQCGELALRLWASLRLVQTALRALGELLLALGQWLAEAREALPRYSLTYAVLPALVWLRRELIYHVG